MNAPLATIRTQDDLVEGMRVAKEMRNLSFKVIDDLGGFTLGHMERVIGPRREKGMSPFVLQMLCSILAVKLIMVPDEEQAKRMADKWEGRDTSNVRLEKGRISKTLLERAKPHVLRASGELGSVIRCQVLSPEDRTRIALVATETRWKKQGRKQTKRARQKRASYHRRKGIRARLAERKLAKMQEGTAV